MAQISLGESRWRMIRRVVHKSKFRYEDTRNQTRHDREHFDWLVEQKFFAPLGNGWFALTERGRDAAELGFYEV